MHFTQCTIIVHLAEEMTFPAAAISSGRYAIGETGEFLKMIFNFGTSRKTIGEANCLWSFQFNTPETLLKH